MSNKRTLIARRNKILPIKFVRQDMTTYSGLTLIDHYLRLYGIRHRPKKAMRGYGFKGDYSQTGHFLTILNRPGNIHVSNQAWVVMQTIRRNYSQFSFRFRADSAFCVPEVINYSLSRFLIQNRAGRIAWDLGLPLFSRRTSSGRSTCQRAPYPRESFL